MSSAPGAAAHRGRRRWRGGGKLGHISATSPAAVQRCVCKREGGWTVYNYTNRSMVTTGGPGGEDRPSIVSQETSQNSNQTTLHRSPYEKDHNWIGS